VPYAFPFHFLGSKTPETQGNVAEAQRVARRRIVDEDDYQRVAKLIAAAVSDREEFTDVRR
jgi:hypothetical protein